MQVLIANITLTLAVLVKLVNIFADKEVWILLFVAMSDYFSYVYYKGKI
jgi:hypothetical protein